MVEMHTRTKKREEACESAPISNQRRGVTWTRVVGKRKKAVATESGGGRSYETHYPAKLFNLREGGAVKLPAKGGRQKKNIRQP